MKSQYVEMVVSPCMSSSWANRRSSAVSSMREAYHHDRYHRDTMQFSGSTKELVRSTKRLVKLTQVLDRLANILAQTQHRLNAVAMVFVMMVSLPHDSYRTIPSKTQFTRELCHHDKYHHGNMLVN